MKRLSEHLWIYAGPINVGILRDGDKALLIDCGDGAVAAELQEEGGKTIDQVLFTHHHRDQCCGAPALIAAGAKIGVPKAEHELFEHPQRAWDNRYGNLRYPVGPSFALTEPLKVDSTYDDGQTFKWGVAEIRALATPGHTAGSMSYEVYVDGKRTIFCGDCIYDEGRVWDIYSLNREYGPFGRTVRNKKGVELTYCIVDWSDYEAFLGARQVLERSLERIRRAGPELLVPSHGRIMDNPARAIDMLAARLDFCFDKYLAISHLRWDAPFVDYYAACVDNTRADYLPLWKDAKYVDGVFSHGADLRAKPNPPCVSHHGATSWVLKSKDGPALVADCEGGVEEELENLVKGGAVKSIEHLWISHFHDDHCRAGVLPFRESFPAATVIADSHVACVIAEPTAVPPLPCLNPEKVQVDKVTDDGESWQWHEFKLTAYHFPGQTLYHGALLAEAGDLKLLFVGDALTAGGIEDYCAFNRNFMGKRVGYDRCLELVEKLKPTHMFYAHRSEAFAYTPEDCRFMRARLAEREKPFAEVMPWDDPNYGLDPWWVMSRPYELHVKAGAEAVFDVILMNHSAVANKAACRANPPRAWGGKELPPASLADLAAWSKAEIPAKTEGRIQTKLPVPQGTEPGRYIIPVDLRYGPWTLPQFSALILIVDP